MRLEIYKFIEHEKIPQFLYNFDNNYCVEVEGLLKGLAQKISLSNYNAYFAKMLMQELTKMEVCLKSYGKFFGIF